jgi:hypothetical protein
MIEGIAQGCGEEGLPSAGQMETAANAARGV